jgi:cyclohexadienyl dehydratase
MRYLQTSALLLALQISSPALAGPALDAVRTRGVLRVGTTGDYKPFSFRNTDGSYTGADIVMARILAQKLEVGIEFVPTTWSTLLPDFIAHKFDVAMGGVSILPERSAQGEFSAVVLVDGKRPIVRCSDKDRFTDISAIDRPDVRVIEPPGASNEAFARSKLTKSQLTIFNDNTKIFDEIIAGRADVMVTDGIEVDHQVYLHPELCSAKVNEPFSTVSNAYLLPKDAEFVKVVDHWIGMEISTGGWQRALDAALHQK